MTMIKKQVMDYTAAGATTPIKLGITPFTGNAIVTIPALAGAAVFDIETSEDDVAPDANWVKLQTGLTQAAGGTFDVTGFRRFIRFFVTTVGVGSSTVVLEGVQ